MVTANYPYTKINKIYLQSKCVKKKKDPTKAKLFKQEEINTISVFLKCLSFKSVLLESLVLNI